MASSDQIQALGQEFIGSYYNDLRTANVASLGARYDETSTFSWESETFTGPQAILQKISDLREGGVFENSHCSAQLRDNILIILSTGTLKIPGQEHGMGFTECFVATVSRNEQGQLQAHILNQISKLGL